jgi:hypothetical protein
MKSGLEEADSFGVKAGWKGINSVVGKGKRKVKLSL